MIMSAILYQFGLSLVGVEAYGLKMVSCLGHMCTLWRLASDSVAGENSLEKFCDTILASGASGCMRKIICFVRS